MALLPPIPFPPRWPAPQVGVPLSRIFIINPKGELRRASSTMQSSTWSSLSAINDLVHQVFAPLQLQQQQEGGYCRWVYQPCKTIRVER